jgi:hypothetical protein
MSSVSHQELDALAELHASELPIHSRILVACIIIAGGRISFTRALEIYHGLIWQVLAHPTKTIKAIHAAHDAALQEETLTDNELDSIASQDKCLEQ